MLPIHASLLDKEDPSEMAVRARTFMPRFLYPWIFTCRRLRLKHRSLKELYGTYITSHEQYWSRGLTSASECIKSNLNGLGGDAVESEERLRLPKIILASGEVSSVDPWQHR